jgi:phage-related minor tail protein
VTVKSWTARTGCGVVGERSAEAVGPLAGALTVKVEVPEPVMEAGEKIAAAPVGGPST